MVTSTLPLFFTDGNWTLDHDETFAKQFFVWDVNRDGFIDANEVQLVQLVLFIYFFIYSFIYLTKPHNKKFNRRAGLNGFVNPKYKLN